MTGAFGEKDTYVAVCFRPTHARFVVAGSELRKCAMCDRDVWAAASTLRALDRYDGPTALRCCCCMKVHTPADLAALGDTMHTHSWEDGYCVCAMSRADFDSEVM